jgi:hypothetical protein
MAKINSAECYSLMSSSSASGSSSSSSSSLSSRISSVARFELTHLPVGRSVYQRRGQLFFLSSKEQALDSLTPAPANPNAHSK